jgi:hypothetical protein
MLPDSLRASEGAFARDLQKAQYQQYTNVPDRGVSVRVGDPAIRAVIDDVIDRTPKELFDRKVGVTLITTDAPRPLVALDAHDLAYWTGNEVRLSQTLAAEDVCKVLEHELGHSLNVYLMHQLGGEQPVRAWHEALFAIAGDEGFVSEYAKRLPIECAAEATRLYLYDRATLMKDFPKQFAFLHRAYRDAFRPAKQRGWIDETHTQAVSG